MRERIAQGILVLTLAVILGLSVLFAARYNESSRPPDLRLPENAATQPARPSSGADRVAIERGRKVFSEQRCTSCHSIAGEGNPRSALDGVGAQMKPDELRHWIFGTGSAAEILSPAVQRRKERYQILPAKDVDALIAYLSSLKEPPP